MCVLSNGSWGGLPSRKLPGYVKLDLPSLGWQSGSQAEATGGGRQIMSVTRRGFSGRPASPHWRSLLAISPLGDPVGPRHRRPEQTGARPLPRRMKRPTDRGATSTGRSSRGIMWPREPTTSTAGTSAAAPGTSSSRTAWSCARSRRQPTRRRTTSFPTSIPGAVRRGLATAIACTTRVACNTRSSVSESGAKAGGSASAGRRRWTTSPIT